LALVIESLLLSSFVTLPCEGRRTDLVHVHGPFGLIGPSSSLSRNGSSLSTECMVQCNLGACEKDQPGLGRNAGFASTYIRTCI